MILNQNYARQRLKENLEGNDIGEVPPRAPCERGWGRRQQYLLGGWADKESEKDFIFLAFSATIQRVKSFVFCKLFLTRPQARTRAQKITKSAAGGGAALTLRAERSEAS